MPKFLWLLRDFTLELGYKHPRDYLEYCLKQDSDSIGGKNVASESRGIKNEIMKIFRDRDCFTLRRPAIDESDLQRLN
jgi:hypothetical protein